MKVEHNSQAFIEYNRRLTMIRNYIRSKKYPIKLLYSYTVGVQTPEFIYCGSYYGNEYIESVAESPSTCKFDNTKPNLILQTIIPTEEFWKELWMERVTELVEKE